MTEVYVQKGERGVLQFYLNKGREAMGFSQLRFQRTQHPFTLKSQLHVALSLSPLAKVLGRYSLPELPNPYSALSHFTPKFRS